LKFPAEFQKSGPIKIHILILNFMGPASISMDVQTSQITYPGNLLAFEIPCGISKVRPYAISFINMELHGPGAIQIY
jgi:hypothetical protein